MEKRIKERFNGQILGRTKRRFGIADDQVQLLDGFESFIYEFERHNQSYILRIGHSFRRSGPLIQGEVDWINYLAAGGASVSKAILCGGQRALHVLEWAYDEATETVTFLNAAVWLNCCGQHAIAVLFDEDGSPARIRLACTDGSELSGSQLDGYHRLAAGLMTGHESPIVYGLKTFGRL